MNKSTTFKMLCLFHKVLIREGFFDFANKLFHTLQRAGNSPIKIFIGDYEDEAYDSGFVEAHEPNIISGLMCFKPEHNGMKQKNHNNGITLIFPEGKYMNYNN